MKRIPYNFKSIFTAAWYKKEKKTLQSFVLLEQLYPLDSLKLKKYEEGRRVVNESSLGALNSKHKRLSQKTYS